MSSNWTKFSDMNHTSKIYGLDINQPQIMTVVNITPDSFFAQSRAFNEEDILFSVNKAITEGASIIDIGGYSSRPGADDVPVDEELRRIELGLGCIRQISKTIPISIDTFRAKVAERAISIDDRVIINDISAGELDPAIVKTVADADVPYIAMHMRGTPKTMQNDTYYKDITTDILTYFNLKTEELISRGINKENIIIDPGFGFAKSLECNYELLGRLNQLCNIGYPLAAGVSRKSMIYKVLETTPQESLYGTTALNWELLKQGVTILRVHDTRAAADTVKIFNKYKSLTNK